MSNDWIDEEGFRANVGIILTDDAGQLLLGGRVSNKGWQFPQGGMLVGEEPSEAMYRELREEVGLERHSKPLCIGQKQRWFMLRLNCDTDKLRFDLGEEAEFDRVRWVDYWRPVNEVIYFKRRVYAQALHELGANVYPHEMPPRPRWWPSRWHSVFDKDIGRSSKA